MKERISSVLDSNSWFLTISRSRKTPTKFHFTAPEKKKKKFFPFSFLQTIANTESTSCVALFLPPTRLSEIPGPVVVLQYLQVEIWSDYSLRPPLPIAVCTHKDGSRVSRTSNCWIGGDTPPRPFDRQTNNSSLNRTQKKVNISTWIIDLVSIVLYTVLYLARTGWLDNIFQEGHHAGPHLSVCHWRKGGVKKIKIK